MKIAISRYELQPTNGSPRGIRQGALLQVAFKDGSVGYSDLHPWPEMGDVPLSIQLELLACGHYTPLVSRSFSFSRIDADARKSNRNLFATTQIPSCHFHLPDLLTNDQEAIEKAISSDKPTIKIKVGMNPQAEAKILNDWAHKIIKSGSLLRLDFNSRLSFESTTQFLSEISALRSSIDFFEDPFPYQPEKWKRFRETTGTRLACDWDSLQALAHANSCDVLVVKPAIQDIFPFLGKARGDRSIVVTSYLDHPIGQLSAAYIAAQAAHTNPLAMSLCGLLTHQVYQENPFSTELSIEGNRLIPSTKGLGFGYDEILKGLIWRSIS